MTKKRKNAKPGRPRILNNEILDIIVECIKEGVSYQHTADYIGVSIHTLNDWRAQGREDVENNDDTIYSALYLGIKKARAEMIKERLRHIRVAGKTNWTADAWLLERLEWKTYGKKEKHEIANAGNKPFIMGHGKIEDINPEELSDRDLNLLLKQIHKKLLEDKNNNDK